MTRKFEARTFTRSDDRTGPKV